jgi:RHS repeat-associated protein
MMTRAHLSWLGVLAIPSLAALLFLSAPAVPQGDVPDSGSAVLSGASWTLLSDGRWLLLGGEDRTGLTRQGGVFAATGTETPLGDVLQVARAWHTATVLPDGRVLILGGVGADGIVGAAELLDPATATSRMLSDVTAMGLTARALHTATLLTDGKVLIAGGVDGSGDALASLELWDPDTGVGQRLATSLASPLLPQTATLLPDGDVYFAGAEGAQGAVFDPTTQQVAVIGEAPATGPSGLSIVGSIPLDGESTVIAGDSAFRVAVRPSDPVLPSSATADTVQLVGPGGPIDGVPIVAEGGRLLFFTTMSPLQAGGNYQFFVKGLRDQEDNPLAPGHVTFTTQGQGQPAPPSSTGRAGSGAPSDAPEHPDHAWVPTKDWRAGALASPWQQLPPLQAPQGITAIAGQVLRLDGEPLRDVTIQVGTRSTRTDKTGRFLLHHVPAGHVVVLIDGRTASDPSGTYGVFEYGMMVKGGQTNAWTFTSWMPMLDTANAVNISSPTTDELVVTTPWIPGLELHVPAGSTVRDHDGSITTHIGITPIPVDRPPFPLPDHVEVPIYFTVQPGGGYVENASYTGAHLVYPNYTNRPPHSGFNFWHYDPDARGWYVYGVGQATGDGKQVVPEPGTVLYEFTGAMINGSDIPPPHGPPPGCDSQDGDPCGLSTGLLVTEDTDLVVDDVMPLTLTRTYRQGDTYNRPFGIGTNHTYSIYLWSDQQYVSANFILPNGGRVFFARTSSGTGFTDAAFDHRAPDGTCPSCVATPTGFDGGHMSWNGQGWDVKLKNGLVYVFGENAPLQAIRDRFGNQITITRDPTGNIARVTSPNGRWLAFTYDTNAHITQVEDNGGRTVGYGYDSSGRLTSVTKPNPDSGAPFVTTYTYDGTSERLKTVRSARLNTACPAPCSQPPTLTLDYYPDGSLQNETLADGVSTWQYSYNFGANGKSSQTDVIDPRGYDRRVTFNSDGYSLSDTRARGQSEQQIISYGREPGTNRILTKLDGLNRETDYGYDAVGNLASITRLANTAQPVTTLYHYEPQFNQLDTITDPLTHQTTLQYRSDGTLSSITDPLTHVTHYTETPQGQIASVTDPLQHESQFAYTAGLLTSITDANMKTTTLVVDPIGEIRASRDPLGHTTKYDYDILGHRRQIIDARGAATRFTYDPDGNLLSVADVFTHTTAYHYDPFGNVDQRTDPLMRVEFFSSDALGNLNNYIDRKGQVATYTYDGLNRQTFGEFFLADATLEGVFGVTYDGGDRLRTLVDSSGGTITRDYFDDFDELKSETTPAGQVSYTYDAAGRRKTLTIAGSPSTSYSYTFDNANRLTQVAQGNTTVGITYYDDNRRKTTTLPNGSIITYTYEPAGRVNAINGVNGTTTVLDLTYGYDDAGNRTTIGGVSRLTEIPQAVSTTSYDNANELWAWGATSLNFDANGSLQSETTGGSTTAYTWDVRHRLIGFATPSLAASFDYDGLGRRLDRTINGQTTTFLYDGANRLSTTTGGVASLMLEGVGLDEHFARIDGTTVTSFLSDALGSTYNLSDGTGAITATYAYEPYGAATKLSGAAATDLQFGGRENDGTGLLYERARYYSPKTGRFISEDPTEFEGGFNLYAYVNNDPTLRVDPSGTGIVDCPGAIADLLAAAENVLERANDIVRNGGCPDRKHVKSLRQAMNRLRAALSHVETHCLGAAEAAAAIAAAEAAAEAAAPYLLIATPLLAAAP